MAKWHAAVIVAAFAGAAWAAVSWHEARTKAEEARLKADDVRKSERKRSSPTREVNGCVHVEPRVDCLKVCPQVESDGRVDSPRTSWQERCS